MAEAPAYKGSIFVAVINEVNKHLASGEISRAYAERFLEPDDFELLEAVIVPSELYPLSCYARFAELLFRTVGNGDIEYLKDGGRRSAVRLIDATGLYAQLNHADHTEAATLTDPEQRWEAFGRDLEIMATVYKSIGNFGSIRYARDPDHPLRWIGEMPVPVEYTDTLVWRTCGFRNEMARRYGHTDLWSWERPEPTLVIWRMKRDI